MLELAIIAILIICALFASKDNIIVLLLTLLPFHSFIKNIINYYLGGGNIFANWKELVVVIFSVRVFISLRKKPGKKNLIIVSVFLSIVLFYFFLSLNPQQALPTLRDHIFPIILFLSIYNHTFKPSSIKPIIFGTIIAGFINALFGFLQAFWLNVPISKIMGLIDFIDESGYIKYKTSSARILGMERMSGILGGPNGFGIYFSFIVIFALGVLFSKNFNLSKYQSRFLNFTLILSVIVLLFSFSRAGWVIAIIGSIILRKLFRVKITFNFIAIILTSITAGIFILSIYFPWAIDIIMDSITGKEISASDRSNNFMNALDVNLSEPFGHGLGTTDHRYTDFLFFSESAFMNIAFEIGIIGLTLLVLMHMSVIKTIYTSINFHKKNLAKIAIAVSIPSIIISFLSINTYGMPYIYLWWIIIGLGINHQSFNLEKPKFRNDQI